MCYYLFMTILSKRAVLSGSTSIPSSKSHTMRACMFASLADGISIIHNPLESNDCKACAKAIESIGAKVSFEKDKWIITGAGQNAHLPDDVVNTDCSGAALYLLAPILATFSGWSVITANDNVKQKPVTHMLEDLRQLNCGAYKTSESKKGAPVIINGPFKSGEIVTKGHYSLALTGLLLAGARSIGKLKITLTDPKETPYLEMTKRWFKSLKMKVFMSDDFKELSISGPQVFPPFERVIPTDWESIAFPLVAGVITDSEFTIENVDTSGGQGDSAIVEILKEMGADIELIEDDKITKTGRLIVRGGTKSRLSNKGRLHGIHINCSSYPDIVTTLAVVASFADGETYIEDVAASRRKAVDRVEIMVKELSELGVDCSEKEDALIVRGSLNSMHGGTVESYSDHRVAMALAVFGLGLKNGSVCVRDAECSELSFPQFYTTMNSLGANFLTK